MTTIHRNHTFLYDGVLYQCSRLGPYGGGDDAWTVYRVRDGRTIDDGDAFDRLSDIRAWVDQAAANGWPLIADDDPEPDPEPLYRLRADRGSQIRYVVRIGDGTRENPDRAVGHLWRTSRDDRRAPWAYRLRLRVGQQVLHLEGEAASRRAAELEVGVIIRGALAGRPVEEFRPAP